MPLLYPIKHVFRNWKLFTALLIGVTLAATFCAAIGVKATVASEESLDKQLSTVITDIEVQTSLNATNLPLAYRHISGIEGVKYVDMVARYSLPISYSCNNYTSYEYTQVTSFPDTSRIYNEWTNKPVDPIPENTTYILLGTELADKVNVGDNITTVITFPTPKYYNYTTIYLNLTVAGYADLTDNGYAYVSGYNGGGVIYSSNGVNTVATPRIAPFGPYSGYRGNMMIVSWENTLQKLWNTTLDSSTVDVTFAVNVDRENLISPWNIEESTAKVNVISQKIQNDLSANYLVDTYPNNMLSSVLYNYQSVFQSMLLQFIWVSIPIFFVAWYLGSTVSDVSFNIRRREIGLLSTKGLSSGQIQRMFLTEALFIGFVGGVLGVIGGIILNQYYLGQVNLNNVFSSAMLRPELITVTIIFGMGLALFSVFMSSRKASKIPAVEALRNYSTTENKSRFRFIPWIALILGGYKIVVFLLGLNISMLLSNALSSGGGFFVSILYTPLTLFDGAMTFFGPFLLFWGLTKILIRDSSKFQAAATKIASLMGDLGALAAKNVRRNPARLAAIAFLIAFIIGYSVQVTGQVASQQDYLVRQIHDQVGGDVTVDVVNQTKGNLIMADLVANVSGIQSASVVRTLSAPVSSSSSSYIQIKTIDPDNFTKSAYYEPEWFTGAPVDQAMKDLKGDNNTIVIDRTLAKLMGKNLYDEVGIDFSSCPRKLRIVGFFGPEPSDQTNQPVLYGSNGAPGYQQNYYSAFYSFVPNNLFNISLPDGDAFKYESFQSQIVISLQTGVNATEVANQIRHLPELKNELYGVNSFDEQWRSSVDLNNLGTFSQIQVLDIQGLGLLFAVISASVGTALIAIVSLQERSREATLMSVRGLSYRQLVFMFLTESVAIITFAVILGVIVGVIIAYGSIAASNAYIFTPQLVMQRLIFPADVVATIGTYIALIYASTIGAILVMSSRYVTKLEKMVRTR